MLVLFHRILVVNVVTRTQKIHIFYEFAHCTFFLFSYCRSRSGHDLMNERSLIHVVGPWKGFSLQLGLWRFTFPSVVRKYILQMLIPINRFIDRLGSVDRGAETTSDVLLYENASTPCNSNIASTYTSPAIWVSLSCSWRNSYCVFVCCLLFC